MPYNEKRVGLTYLGWGLGFCMAVLCSMRSSCCRAVATPSSAELFCVYCVQRVLA